MTRSFIGCESTILYDSTIKATEIDPFERPTDFIQATVKHNKKRKALREVADEHFGPDNSGTSD